jgi:hypothetical protein
MRGSPWEPQPGVDSVEIYSKIKIRSDKDPEPEFRIPIGVDKPKRINRFRIEIKDIERHGMSEDCDACMRQMTGDTQRKHTEACRERFEKKLMEEGDPRILKELDRLDAQKELAREMAAPIIADKKEEDKEDSEIEGEDMDIKEDESDAEGDGDDMVLDKGSIMRMSIDEEMEERLKEMSKTAGKRRVDWKSDVDQMSKALKRENISVAVMEIYSPPRVDAIARMWDLLPGWSLDLTVDGPDDGKPWDFSKPEKRDTIEQLLMDKPVLLLIGSLFSGLLKSHGFPSSGPSTVKSNDQPGNKSHILAIASTLGGE